MKVSITTRHFKLADNIKSMIEEQFEKFTKYSDNILDADVILEKNNHRSSVEIKIKVDRSLITVQAEDYDLIKVIEKGIKKTESRIKKHAGKYHRRKKDENKKGYDYC